MNTYILSFLISFGAIGAKSIQQQNCTHKLYWLIPPFSLILAIFEVYIVHIVSKNGLDDMMYLVLALGLGGGLGSVCAVYLHDKLIMNKEK